MDCLPCSRRKLSTTLSTVSHFCSCPCLPTAGSLLSHRGGSCPKMAVVKLCSEDMFILPNPTLTNFFKFYVCLHVRLYITYTPGALGDQKRDRWSWASMQVLGIELRSCGTQCP